MSLADDLRALLDAAEAAEKQPHGPALEHEHRQSVGEALVRLRGGDADTARTAWKMIVDASGGYMPAIAARALVIAASPNLVPDVEAPDGTG